MAKVSEMLASKYLKKEDVGNGVLVTISGFNKENLALDGQPPQWKWCMTFQELEKPLVLNGTNIRLCEMIFNSGDTDDWINNKIVLYNDPSIQFQGKFTGGIRVRAPKQIQSQKPSPKAIEELDDDIPF